MFSVGLTGGIASGKTTVSNLFAEHGVPIIDTDIISRELLEPEGLAFEQVHKHFGDEILLNGQIDRRALRRIVFSSPGQKQWLEDLLHPLIYQASHDAIAGNSTAAYQLLVVPLMFETGFESLVDRVLVIDCPPDQQVKRLMDRDNIDEALAAKMLAQQMGNAERIARAQDVIENANEHSNLSQQVEDLHHAYLALATG